ncbi:uncharacterized protein [Pleurodeles waltl]|uniref:uncharacterized protein n=1 Tax=Pleurodeles waltl TaxID=8319 RepID=UPI0037093845
MERRQAPETKRKEQCSPERVRAALPISPVHNVSASGSQNSAEQNHELEPLSGNLPNVILLSLLEQLEAKLDNLHNTLEDVPSRVAGLMEKIWKEKCQYHLENGGVSLGMVSPVMGRSRPLPLNLLVRESNLNHCLQTVSPHGHEPQQNHCLQPTSLHCCESQQRQCLHPVSQDGHGLQQDCTVSRCPPLGVPVILGEPNLWIPPTFDDEEEPQQDQCTQLEPEERVKKEELYADSWDPQQNFCLHPSFHIGHEPQQNHYKQPVLPDKKESDERIKQELLWFDGEGPQQNHCRQPVFQEEQSLQHNAGLQQVLFDAQEQHQNCKTEPMQSEAQNADQHYKLEPLHPEHYKHNYKQVPLQPEEQDENYEQAPLLPADRDENSDLQLTCTDMQGLSVCSSILAQNTADTGEAIVTDPLDRGKSDVLLFKAIPDPTTFRHCP